MKYFSQRLTTLILGVSLSLTSAAPAFAADSADKIAALKSKINHVVVIYQENWSFDGLYGLFPGANGIKQASLDSLAQKDKDGTLLTKAPLPKGLEARTDIDVASLLKPFDSTRFYKPEENTSDLVHRFYTEQLQIDGGKMDKFVSWSDNGGLVMSYFDATNLPEGKLAQKYVLFDNFFHAAFGGSFLNHFWLIAARSPVFPNAPSSLIGTAPDEKKLTVKDAAVSPDGFAVNTSFSINHPHPASVKDATTLVPNQTFDTIGDRLTAKSISWSWFSGGWNDALAGKPDALFQFHHQPFVYFEKYKDGTPAKQEHLKDELDFMAQVKAGTLPAVSYVKPLGPDNEHPGYAQLLRGQQHVADLVTQIQNSPLWKDTVIIITYDENGGRWDHVTPPQTDKWGPGTRVPTILISPFAKKATVDHTAYDTTAILRFIEKRWDLAPLGERDAQAGDLLTAFDF